MASTASRRDLHVILQKEDETSVLDVVLEWAVNKALDTMWDALMDDDVFLFEDIHFNPKP
jgi:hypothetical protein